MAGGFLNIFKLGCPRCRQGKLYKNPNPYAFKEMGTMNKSCPTCGQDFVIEPGFYFGATYVSYALNFAWIIPLFVLIYVVLDWPFETFVVTMFILLPLLMPLILRASRSAFLAMYVKYDKELANKLKAQA